MNALKIQFIDSHDTIKCASMLSKLKIKQSRLDSAVVVDATDNNAVMNVVSAAHGCIVMVSVIMILVS